jgi:hypothetical protein
MMPSCLARLKPAMVVAHHRAVALVVDRVHPDRAHRDAHLTCVRIADRLVDHG